MRIITSIKDDEPVHKAAFQYHINAKKYPQVHLVFWLLAFTNVLDKYTDNEMGKIDSNWTGFNILLNLLEYPHGISQQGIAKLIGRTKQAIMVAIDKLEDKGYVKRGSNKDDRRVNFIRITPKGIDYLNNVFPHTLAMCDEALSFLSEGEMEQMLHLTIKVTKNLWQKIGVPIVSGEHDREICLKNKNSV